MNYLLDTNVVSELVKPAVNRGVAKFFAETDEDAMFLSVVTLAELQYGIERMPAGAKRARLQDWLQENLAPRFDGRTLALDGAVAAEWGRTMARGEKLGRSMTEMDAWIAAVATVHDLALVTRNADDFAAFGGEMANPWE